MKTEDFLDTLEHRNLVPRQIVDQIREKLAQGQHRLTAKSVLKYLVKKELVTRRQAKELLETTLTVSPSTESSILGFVPAPEMPAEKSLGPEISLTTDKPEESLLPAEPLGKGTLEPVAEEAAIAPDSLIAPLLEASDPSDELLAGAVPMPTKKKKRRRRKKGRKENEWDSSLLLIGGGGLVALLVAGLFIFYLLTRENADQILEEAGGLFDSGSYTQAISQYEKFVEGFPSHPQFSAGKVRLGMARLWKMTQGTSNYEKALQTAKQVIANIEDEKEFEQAKEDLASLLPKIAIGLAEQAEQANDLERIQQRIEQATTALSLCSNTKYIPKAFRNEAVLDEVKATLSRVERRRQENADLRLAIGAIDEKIGAGDTAAAYAIQKNLLKQHPGLLSDESLAEKVLEISQAEKSVVRYVAESRPAETTERESNVIASLALAERRGPASPLAHGTVGANVDGAVYGLQANDGALLWRRFVGLDSLAAPVALDGGNYLVIDAAHHELLRLDGKTGKLKWRQSFEKEIAQPVVVGERIFVATASGKLAVLNAISGQQLGAVQFGQPLRVPPALGHRGKRIYVVGEHSSLYTLDAGDLSCLGVYYLGHAKGTVAVPPVVLLNKIAVAVNSGLATCQLRILGINDSGSAGAEIARTRLEGLITTPLLPARRRLIAVTSLGAVSVYEIGTGDGDSALTQLATRDAERGSPVARFGAVHEGHVWVAGTELNKLAILPTGNRLPVRDVDHNYAGSTFDHPLRMVDNLVIHVRRPGNQAGTIVAAMEAGSGKSLWETKLAVPPAGAPAVDRRGPRITAANAAGAVFEVDRQAMGRRVQDQSKRLNYNGLPLTESVALDNGRMVYAPRRGAKNLLLYEPDALRNPLRRIKLVSETTCPPVAWRNGIAVPTQIGQVFFFDTESGKPTFAPFQPPLAAGAKYDWLTPAVARSDDRELLVLSDGDKKIYLLDQQAEPQPHLVAMAEADVGPSPLVTPLAVVGNVVYAGTRNGKLARFRLPSLKPEDEIELGGRTVWGPFAAGLHMLMVTENDEFLCIDVSNGGHEIVWRQPLEHGGPIGQPLLDGEDILQLWSRGRLSRIRLQSGKETAALEITQPVVTGPVSFGNRLVLTSHDGTLLVVDAP